MKAKIKQFWLKNEQKIVLGIGFILIAAISFEFGLIQGKKVQESPLVIEKPAMAQVGGAQAASASTSEAQNLPQKAATASAGANIPAKDCTFVGSKNSNKYHLPTCQWAKRIKPENITCFSSVEDAVSKGYQSDKGCIK